MANVPLQPGLPTGYTTFVARFDAGAGTVLSQALTESGSGTGVYCYPSTMSLAPGSYNWTVVDTNTNIIWAVSEGPFVWGGSYEYTLAEFNNTGQTSPVPTAGGGPSASGICQAGSTGGTIVLDTSASPVNGTYNGQVVRITGGTGSGQAGVIGVYTGASRTATVYFSTIGQTSWSVIPDSTSEYAVTGSVAAVARSIALTSQV